MEIVIIHLVLWLLLICFIFVTLCYWIKIRNVKREFVDKMVDYATIVIGFMSVGVGVVSISVMLRQEKFQNKIAQDEMLLHQPVFHADYYLQDYSRDDVNDSEEICICSEGDEPFDITDISVKSFLRINYINTKEFSRNVSTTIPFAYYAYSYKLGTCIKKYAGTANLHKYETVINQALYEYHNVFGNIGKVDLYKIDLVKITYIDKYDIERVVYFNNGRKTTEKEYLSVINNVPEDLNNNNYDIQSMSSKDILQIIDDLSKKCI